jgi:4'-phosphopantetheinyl transferase
MTQILTRIISTYGQDNSFVTQMLENALQLKLYFGDQKNFPDELSVFYGYLSDMEISRSKRFVRKTDERTYVITHALVNRKLSECLGKDFNALTVQYFENKKPYVSQETIDFNISHSSDYFVFALSKMNNIRIGVDVETVKTNFDREGIVNHYFHKNEKQYIMNDNLSEEKQNKRFFEIWTRKEAFLKMLGIGLTNNLAELDLSPGEREIFVQSNVFFDAGNFPVTYIYTLNLSEDQVVSVATNRPVVVIPEYCKNV